VRGLLDDERERRLALDADARRKWEAFHDELEPRLGDGGDLADEGLGDWSGKLLGLTARLVALLHEGDYAGRTCPPTIPAATMQRAIELARYALAHALYCFGAMGADERTTLALRAWSAIEKEAAGALEVRHQAVWQRAKTAALKSPKALEPALELLREHGYLAPIPGKPRRLALNPEAVKRAPARR